MRKFFLIAFALVNLIAHGQSPMRMLIKHASSSLDPDAQNYINRVEAAGRALTPTEEGYINTYFLGLKADGIWTKIVDRGLLIWGIAAANAEKFKGGTDLTWNGTVTHASDGAVSNGTTGYADLNITPSTAVTLNDTHLAIYSQTNAAITNACDIGSRNGTSQAFAMFLKTGTTLISDQYTTSTSTGRISVTMGTTAGYTVATRVSSTDLRAIGNGTQIGATQTNASTGTRPSISMFLMCQNISGTPTGFSTRKMSMWSVGAGLTTTDAANDNTLTEAYMDSMGIGVQ